MRESGTTSCARRGPNDVEEVGGGRVFDQLASEREPADGGDEAEAARASVADQRRRAGDGNDAHARGASERARIANNFVHASCFHVPGSERRGARCGQETRQAQQRSCNRAGHSRVAMRGAFTRMSSRRWDERRGLLRAAIQQARGEAGPSETRASASLKPIATVAVGVALPSAATTAATRAGAPSPHEGPSSGSTVSGCAGGGLSLARRAMADFSVVEHFDEGCGLRKMAQQ